MTPPDDIPLALESRVALACAEDAGAVLLRYWRREGIREAKAGGEPVSIADREADVLIRAALEEAFPNDGLLSEEHADDGTRRDHRRVWIIDPLDGTRDFLDETPEFAVHVALAVDGRPALGVIHAPALERTWFGIPGSGAWARDGDDPWQAISVAPLEDPVRLAVTRRKIGTRTRMLLGHLPAHILTPRGGCGLKAALVAEGTCDVYAGVTRQMKEWDLCAAHAVAEAAGAVCTDLDGRALSYNADDVVARGGFLVASPDAANRLRAHFEAAAADLRSF